MLATSKNSPAVIKNDDLVSNKLIIMYSFVVQGTLEACF